MTTDTTASKPPVALITGAARRIGATIASSLHREGFNVVLHYRHSQTEAGQLAQALNQLRADSAICLGADLGQLDQIESLAQRAQAHWGRLDALINNASSFYPSPLGEATEHMWDDLVGSNLKAPFFLAQALAPALRQARGAVVNIADIHTERPLRRHTIYCVAKAGNVMLTKSLARELAPEVRVNGIAPGAILWPEGQAELTESDKRAIIENIPLCAAGTPADIADTIVFLLTRAAYITGQILAVDGGRTLT